MKTALEMFKDIKELETTDGPKITIEDIFPFFCEKVENNLKAIQIIAEKGLPLGERDMIRQSANYNEYNIKFSWANFKDISIQKSEVEFKILKEVISYE